MAQKRVSLESVMGRPVPPASKRYRSPRPGVRKVTQRWVEQVTANSGRVHYHIALLLECGHLQVVYPVHGFAHWRRCRICLPERFLDNSVDSAGRK